MRWSGTFRLESVIEALEQRGVELPIAQIAAECAGDEFGDRLELRIKNSGFQDALVILISEP